MNEYIYSNVKKKVKEDYFPSLNSVDLIGEGGENGDSINWADEYFTTVALEDGTITFTPQNSNVISYSTDNGNTWTEGNSIEVNNGDSVMWKGTMTPSNGIGSFSATCKFDVQGNVMSLIYGDGFKNQLSLEGKNSCFGNLLGESKVVSAKDLVLPATTLAEGCYVNMFLDCTNLTTAPELPATTLAENCYNSMFQGCTSLTSAPELPATTLIDYCYGSMFARCASLVTAPTLPATILVNSCYDFMFYECTRLNYIKAMFTTPPSMIFTSSWVEGVSATGTFVKNSAAQWSVSGADGIPEGWTVVEQ